MYNLLMFHVGQGSRSIQKCTSDLAIPPAPSLPSDCFVTVESGEVYLAYRKALCLDTPENRKKVEELCAFYKEYKRLRKELSKELSLVKSIGSTLLQED